MDSITTIINQPPSWSPTNEQKIAEPYTHVTRNQGKKFRSVLIQAFNKLYRIPDPELDIVIQIIETLHNSSLIIDDIEDGSALRRGQPAAHVLYGVPMSLNTANYMYFKAMDLIWKLPIDATIIMDLLKIFNEELVNLHRGQGLDIYWRDSLKNYKYDGLPDEEMYFNMVMNKTGGLFRLTIRMMETLSTVNFGQSMVPLCNLLGIIYQVRDDYQNLINGTMIANKGFADDISEGKMSFPIIHGLRYERDNKLDPLLLNIILKKTDDIDMKNVAVDFLKYKSRSLDHTESIIKQLVKLIKNGDYIPKHKDENALSQINYIIDHISNI